MKSNLRSLSLLFSLIFLLLGSCTPTEKMTYKIGGSDPYIHDFKSRLAQSKLRGLKDQYRAANVGLFFLGVATASIDAADDHIDYNHNYLVSSGIKKFRIVNDSKYSMQISMRTNAMIDSESSASILKIILFPKQKAKFLVPSNTFYEIKCWNQDTDDIDFIDLNSSNYGKLIIENRRIYPY